MKSPRLALLFFLAAACAVLRASVTPAALFTDHAVLQSGRVVPVWGRARPREAVTVTFHGQSVTAIAGPDGRWTAWLAPLDATAVGTDLVIAGRNEIRLHDVVVGEVWLCSGQSNMEFSVGGHKLGLLNARQEIAAADHPLIRHFKVKTQESDTPIDTAEGSWQVCSPATVVGFTAVGYFFARDISRRLQVPVGLINSTWGGTPVESWLSDEALKGDPAFAAVARHWTEILAKYPARQAAYDADLLAWNRAEAAAKASGPAAEAAFRDSHPPPFLTYGRVGGPWTPGGLFNGMIQPLIPYALRGVLWYQGEANVYRPFEYHRLFAAMITDWRTRFGQGDIPFFWVQLPNFEDVDPTHTTRAFLREAQAQTLDLPATGQAVTIDVGDPNNNHPANKQEVGRRLALIAKAKVYGLDVDFSGPVFTGFEREGRLLRLRFAYAENGLTAAGRPLQSFEVAGADRQFHPATAVIAGDTVLVQSPEVAVPVAVRYAWRNAPIANLYNGAGLPAAPFRSDDWAPALPQGSD